MSKVIIGNDPHGAEKASRYAVTPLDILPSATWDHTEFSGHAEKLKPFPIDESLTLYMVVAGDEQSPCRWNGRQLTIEWIDEKGVPLFSYNQASALIEQTYLFFASVGRTVSPILRAVPVFQIQPI